MNKHIKYLFKEAFPLLVIITLMMAIISGSIAVTMGCKYKNEVPAPYLAYPNPSLEALIVPLAILSSIMPIFLFLRYKKRDAVDIYFALPLCKKVIFFSKILVGFLLILISFTISYLLTVFILLLRGAEFDMIQYIPLYFLLILAALAIYLIDTLFVLKAKNNLDAAMLVVLYWIVSTLSVSSLTTYLDMFKFTSQIRISPFIFAPFIALEEISTFYRKMLISKMPAYEFGENYESELRDMYLYLGIQVAFALLAVSAIIYEIKKYKNDNVEGRTKSWFGYKIMLPLFLTFAIMSNFRVNDLANTLILCLIYIVAYLALTMILEFRSFKIPKSRYIVMLAIMVLTIGGSMILNIIANSIY